MTIRKLLEEFAGVDSDMEVLIATEQPKGSWSISEVSIVGSEDNAPTVFLHCDVPRY